MRSARVASSLVFGGLIFSALGCTDAHFSGQAPVKKEDPPEPVSQTLDMTCAGGALQREVELHPGTLTKASLRGELCPTATGTATVLFVVDYSGSMGKHMAQQGDAAVLGNDPQVSAGCGRLDAAKAVLGQLATEGTAEVKVGVVPFAGNVVREKLIDLTNLAEFQAFVTKETFCSYVVQSPSFGLDPENAGAVQSQSANSSTNYAAALSEAQAMLANEPGHKVVYFISDGQPTSGGQDPAAAGVLAGEELRAGVGDLTLNGLLLGSDGAKALEVMQAITGDESRVRVAAKASELATEIVKFPSLDLTDATATLQRGDGGTEELSLATFAKVAGSSVWSFLTGEFELQAGPGRTVPHKVTVAAKTLDGQAVQVLATINARRL